MNAFKEFDAEVGAVAREVVAGLYDYARDFDSRLALKNETPQLTRFIQAFSERLLYKSLAECQPTVFGLAHLEHYSVFYIRVTDTSGSEPLKLGFVPPRTHSFDTYLTMRFSDHLPQATYLQNRVKKVVAKYPDLLAAERRTEGYQIDRRILRGVHEDFNKVFKEGRWKPEYAIDFLPVSHPTDDQGTPPTSLGPLRSEKQTLLSQYMGVMARNYRRVKIPGF